MESDYQSYKHKADALNVKSSLDNLDDLVYAFSESVYRSATISNSRVEEESQVSFQQLKISSRFRILAKLEELSGTVFVTRRLSTFGKTSVRKISRTGPQR